MLVARSGGAGIRCPCATPAKGLCPSFLHRRLYGGRAVRCPCRKKEHTPRKSGRRPRRKEHAAHRHRGEAASRKGRRLRALGKGVQRQADGADLQLSAGAWAAGLRGIGRKAAAATEQFHALSAQIKAAETRMAEIAVLKPTSPTTPRPARFTPDTARPVTRKVSRGA